ncbi:MAG: 3-oxoadipate enol-lactonase, partial [Rhodobacteraceae bacterium]|nr:3-oxoadipate enol-lactonase [Paracoccaceae bacterium]
IALVRAGGLAAIAEPTLERWLGRGWRENPVMPILRDMFLAGSAEGWIGCAAAIAGTDFYETAALLRLPTLALAGTNDGSTPPDLVRETAELIPGAQFRLIRGAGHIPCVETPETMAALIAAFLEENAIV